MKIINSTVVVNYATPRRAILGYQSHLNSCTADEDRRHEEGELTFVEIVVPFSPGDINVGVVCRNCAPFSPGDINVGVVDFVLFFEDSMSRNAAAPI